jgi:hypothetical protein
MKYLVELFQFPFWICFIKDYIMRLNTKFLLISITKNLTLVRGTKLESENSWRNEMDALNNSTGSRIAKTVDVPMVMKMKLNIRQYTMLIVTYKLYLIKVFVQVMNSKL